MSNCCAGYIGKKIDFEKLKSEKHETRSSRSEAFWDWNRERQTFNGVEVQEVMAWHLGESELLVRTSVDCQEICEPLIISKVEFEVCMYLNDSYEIQGFEFYGHFESLEIKNFDSQCNSDILIELFKNIDMQGNGRDTERQIDNLPNAIEADLCRRLESILVNNNI